MKRVYVLGVMMVLICCFTHPSLHAQCSRPSASDIYTFCYQNRTIEIIKVKKKWTDAASCARQWGGELVMIDSQEVQDTVYHSILNGAKISTSYVKVSDGGGVAYVWIGASDYHKEGKWIWDGDNDGKGVNFWNGEGNAGSGNGSAVSGMFINWGGTSKGSPNEPDDYLNNQDAAGIGLDGWPSGSGSYGIAGEWNDINVSNQLYFVVQYIYETTKNVSICRGDSIYVEGGYQTQPGTYYDTLSTVLGCDSLIITQLHYKIIKNVVDTAICKGDSIFLQGAYQTTSGAYFDTLSAVNGCDSLVITQLSINPSYQKTVNMTICQGDSIFLQGAYQHTAGTYRDTLPTIMGCDSIITTDLKVNPSYLIQQQQEICGGDSLMIGGQYRKTSGTYYDTLSTNKGCDSIFAVHLTVKPSYNDTVYVTICEGDSIMLEGAYRKFSGTFIDSFKTTEGCDSVIQTALTVVPTAVINDNVTICYGDSIMLGGSYRHTSGTYTDTFTASYGCDSVVVTTLTVNQVDTGITASGNTLTATPNADAYQWLNCTNNYAIINGATSQSYTATASGDYAVEITSASCVDTSNCYFVDVVGIKELATPSFSVFPNPVGQTLNIQFDEPLNKVDVKVIDVLGKVLLNQEAGHQQTLQLDVSGLHDGIYVIEVITPKGRAMRQIVVK